MRLSPLTLLALTLLAAGSAAQGVTIRVPQDQPTIQAAVDAANDQDKILVSAGTYAENVLITGAQLLSITGKGKVVIAPESGAAVTLDDSDFIVLKNLRTKGGENGFRIVASSSCQLVKCRVQDSTGDGVRIEGGSNNAVLKTTIRDAGADAIALATGVPEFTNFNQVIGCKLFDPVLDGVGIHGTGNLVIACKVFRAGRDGLAVETTTPGADNRFERCKLLQPGRMGLYFSGNGMVVDRCTVVGSLGHGIEFTDGLGGGVAKTRLIQCEDDGVLVGGDGFSLEKLKITSPANEGVIVSGDDVIAFGCKVSGAGANGFSVQGHGGDYSGNKSSGAALNGFLLQGAGNTLSLNKASGSGEFDLNDPVPANNTVADDNTFKTIGP